MQGNDDTFRQKTHDLALVLAGHRDPITFVLGAGASLSSGAPSTPEVRARFEEVTLGRFEGEVRERFHELKRAEVREHLRPLFAEVLPDVGYRLLAALARHRRINVVSLNWDGAVEKACDEVGVRWASFDPLFEENQVTKEGELPADEGVLVVHAHGTLDDDPRYGYLDTLPDHPEIWAAVAPLLAYETIICGASLRGDLDVAHVIKRFSDRDGDRDGATTWLFVRPGGGEPPVSLPNSWVQVSAEQVDFDDLVVMLAEEILAAAGQSFTRWDDLVDELPYLELPRADEIVELKPVVRRQALAAQVAGLVAPPYSGKTVGVVRLGHLRRLIDGVEEPLRVSVEAQDSPVELSLAATRRDVAVSVDDPFGSGEPEANPLIVDFLVQLCEGKGGYAAVSSPSSNWEAEAGELREKPAGLYLAPSYAGAWYERDRLARFADQREHRTAAIRRVHQGKIVSPPEALEVGRTGQDINPDRLIEDKFRRLKRDPRLGQLCAIVRLQERAGEPISEAELSAILGCEASEVKGAGGLLMPQHLSKRSFFIFNHPTSGLAADRYLASRFDEVRALLEEAMVLPAWIDRCLLGWALASGRVTEEEQIVIEGDAGLEPADWIGARLGSRPDEETLASLPLEPRDDWSTIDLAYEIVRLWSSIEHLESGRQLLADLIDRPMGLYGLLEGCLYFGVKGSDPLWTRLMGRLHEVRTEPSRSFEMLLIADAVVWREPFHGPLDEWAAETITALAVSSPEFAIVRFAAGYHGPGLRRLAVEKAVRDDGRLSWSAEQAEVGARLVAWHFAHQSRARVLMHRRSDIDKAWLCQSTGQGRASQGDPEAQLRLIASLAEHPQSAGWGFHLGCNLAVVDGLDLHRDSAYRVVLESLEAASARDTGVISAVVAYRSADHFSRKLRERPSAQEESELVLNAMGLGIEVFGTEVEPPRFRFVDDPIAAHKAIGRRFPKMDAALPSEPAELAAGLWKAAGGLLEARSREVRRAISVKIEEVRRGDLRPVVSQTRLDEPTGDPFADAVLRMVHDWESRRERLI